MYSAEYRYAKTMIIKDTLPLNYSQYALSISIFLTGFSHPFQFQLTVSEHFANKMKANLSRCEHPCC